MPHVASARRLFIGHGMRKRRQQGVIGHEALELADNIGLERTRRLDNAIQHLHIRHSAAILGNAHIEAVDATRHMAHQRAAHFIDALAGNKLAHRRIVRRRGAVALELKHQDIQVALDHRMHLTGCRRQIGIGIEHAELLLVHKRMSVAIEYIVREKSQGKGAPKLRIVFLQMAHAVTQAGELL